MASALKMPLGFVARRELMAVPFRGRPNPIGADAGLSVSVAAQINTAERDAVVGDRSFRADWRRLLRNFGGKMVRDAQRVVRQTDTIDTRLFLSSWSTVQVAEDPTDGLETLIALTNSAPYSGYVHPKGRKGTLVVDIIRSRYARAWKSELVAAVKSFRKTLAKKIVNKAAREAAKRKR